MIVTAIVFSCDDPDGKWNYEVFVKTSGKESGFEVDPTGNS